MAVKDFGTLLKKSGTSIGEIEKVSVPEIVQEAVETTNHSTTGGGRTYIPNGLIALQEFEVTVVGSGSTIGNVYADMVAGTVASYTVVYPVAVSGSITTWGFSAFPTSIKLAEADATKPEAVKAVIKFQPSGSMVLS